MCGYLDGLRTVKLDMTEFLCLQKMQVMYRSPSLSLRFHAQRIFGGQVDRVKALYSVVKLAGVVV